MARVLKFVIFALVLLVVISFSYLNTASVPLNYYLGTQQLPLYLITIGSLCIGALIGALVVWLSVVKLKHQNKKLQKSVKSAEQEVLHLRAAPVKNT